MQRFARLLDDLAYTQSRNGKLALLAAYFRSTPDPERGWALAALTDGLPVRLPLRRALMEIMAPRVDPVLYQLSRDYVGDTAETVALLWEPPPLPPAPPPGLDEVVEAVRDASAAGLGAVLAGFLDRLDADGRWAMLKLLGGAPRVGVSARLARIGLAQAFDHDPGEIEEVWHVVRPPYVELFAWLAGGARPEIAGRPVFRPLMLAHPIDEADFVDLNPAEIAAEWKWDGIRIQIAATGGEARLYSRTGDEISSAFPEIAAAFAGAEITADGELLVLREGEVAPFNDLQQRLNRKAPSARQMAAHPAHVRLYDALLIGAEDIRPLAFEERRKLLEAWHAEQRPPLADLSPLVPFATFEELKGLHAGARAAGIEGLMLKRRASPYLAGRPKGHWFKWKRNPLTLDCVLMYAQRGSGKRSSFYSDYTFGVWRQGAEARELVPVGKAYSGYSDVELLDLDRFIRGATVETFGPVRAVRPELVLEIAFDSVHASARHKSGVAMRFPRIHRLRWDKPAAEADTLETVLRLLE